MRSLFAIAVAMKKSSDGFAAPRLSFLNAVSQCIMTRINCGIPPAELSDRHLIAEHREIKRVPNLVRKGRYSMKGQPVEFTLGTGHIKFFYDKLGYLLERYQQLCTSATLVFLIEFNEEHKKNFPTHKYTNYLLNSPYYIYLKKYRYLMNRKHLHHYLHISSIK